MPTVTTWSEPVTRRLVVEVVLAGRRHRRILGPLSDDDVADLRIAGSFWEHGDRAARLDFTDAAVTEHCLAIERLFPHLREELPR